MLVALAKPGLGFTHPATERVVENCAGDTRGKIRVVSPQPGDAFSSRRITVKVRTRCRGGLGFQLGVDGVGYALSGSGLLEPATGYDEGCPPDLRCWPTLPAEADFRHDLRLRPGQHVLEIGASFGGTDLPRWQDIRITFSVGSLASTGPGLHPWVAISLLLLLTGMWILSRSPRNRTRERRPG